MNTREMLELLKKKTQKVKYVKNIVKCSAPGKIRFQLLAPDEMNIVMQREVHSIPPLPGIEALTPEDSKWLYDNCTQTKTCPICQATENIKNKGITPDKLNSVLKPNYPYTDDNIRKLFRAPTTYQVCVLIHNEATEDGKSYIRDEVKNEETNTYVLSLSYAMYQSLISAYSDFCDEALDAGVDEDKMALYAIYDKNTDKYNDSVVIDLHISRDSENKITYNFDFLKPEAIDKTNITQSIVDAIADNDMWTRQYHPEACVNRLNRLNQILFSNSVGFDTADDINLDSMFQNDFGDLSDNDLPF